MPGRGGRGEILEVDDLGHALRRGQVLGRVDDSLDLIDELCRPRRRDVEDMDPPRRAIEDEVDVLVAPAHDDAADAVGCIGRRPG